MNRYRLYIQAAFTALTNGYLKGFLKGRIYKGSTKALCVPGLNCYSCPGALGSCPIGALQAVLGSRQFQFSAYLLGFFLLIGTLIGRVVCGFLCPFGLVQDLLYRIPLGKKRKSLPGHHKLKWLKYAVLIIFVIILPMFAVNLVGMGDPWFCKWICPSGTLLGGIPLVASNPPLREAVGLLFGWKLMLLVIICILSIRTYRPFCNYLCPLGAIYGFFNPIALYRLNVDEHKCISCGKCEKVCKMDIKTYETPNSPECIRCGDCIAACPTKAIRSTVPGSCPHRNTPDAQDVL